ncbi:methyltransferase domain-containing protein [Synechococcales cyanobacterium C]|uniref:Methyltransferase domain-containing protein n=1 Tax=Petrachloros mirabilis ULC683 TaxID=2781853 RepID=A0A8K2A264_9CYAN|nr:class I SAM-dependent methyltransferase [Petrachloros mirabilis]NCJ08152.1 methyltransferase domain-containing protein [Petrachloros mirabilis ULC683]
MHIHSPFPAAIPQPDQLFELAYRTLQWSKNSFGLAHKTLSSRLMNWLYPAPSRETQPIDTALLANLQQRYEALLTVDWQDAQRGIYPPSLLFDHPWDEFFRYYPNLWLDLPQMWLRSQQQQHQDFAPQIKTEGYPKYYLQNFHHQTNGYLSDDSANLYDLQVDILFGGTADAMRRRVLAPLKQGLAHFSTLEPSQLKILDVACGTGRTLRQLRATFPQTALLGCDLSAAYLRKANQTLHQLPGELPQLIQANAEALPYANQTFHGITSVFLFHELPPAVRRSVIQESYRLLKPGGTLIICDSIQMSDSPEFAPMMANFPKLFHEPYYRHYTTDDLEAVLAKVGFTPIQTSIHLMSKYWIAQKPSLIAA